MALSDYDVTLSGIPVVIRVRTETREPICGWAWSEKRRKHVDLSHRFIDRHYDEIEAQVEIIDFWDQIH